MRMLRFYVSANCIPNDDELNVSDTETQAEMHKPQEQSETPVISVDLTYFLSQGVFTYSLFQRNQTQFI